MTRKSLTNPSIVQAASFDNYTDVNIQNFTILPDKPPFPPKIKPSDITSKRKISEISLRPPNAFIIYRKVFLNHLSPSRHGSLKMTDASKLVSMYWNNEPEIVKDAYKQISKQVEDELNEKKKQNIKLLENRVVWKNSKRSKKYKQKNGYEPPEGKKRTRENTKDRSVGVAKRNVVYEFVSITPETIVNTSSKNSKCERNHQTQTRAACSNDVVTPVNDNPVNCTLGVVNTSGMTTPETPESPSFIQTFHDLTQQPFDPFCFPNVYFQQGHGSDFQGENLTYYSDIQMERFTKFDVDFNS